MFIQKYGLYLAWLLACIGTLGSLFFSVARHMEPCNLCWYQRIALFPLVIVLGLAAYRGFLGIARYVVPLVIIGLVLSLYQIAIQEIPGWNPIDMCGKGPSCSAKHFIGLGPITIPMLSTVGFLVIGALLGACWSIDRKRVSVPIESERS